MLIWICDIDFGFITANYCFGDRFLLVDLDEFAEGDQEGVKRYSTAHQ